MPRREKDEGLQKEEKLRRKRDFQVTAQEGIKRHTRNFLIIVRKNDIGFSRLGAVASKKVGNAVERNRVKRLIREFFRKSKGKIPHSTDYIIVGKRGAHDLNYTAVVQELSVLLEVPQGEGRKRSEVSS